MTEIEWLDKVRKNFQTDEPRHKVDRDRVLNWLAINSQLIFQQMLHNYQMGRLTLEQFTDVAEREYRHATQSRG
jgi:hypothetical protein